MHPTQNPQLADLARLLAERLQPPPQSAADTILDTIQRLADYLPHITWIADPSGRVIHYNRAFYAYAGRDDMVCWDLMHPEDVPATESAWHASVDKGRPYEHLVRLRDKAGIYHWHLERASPVRCPQDAAGCCPDKGIVCWVGVSVDSEPVLSLRERRAAA